MFTFILWKNSLNRARKKVNSKKSKAELIEYRWMNMT